MKREEFELVIVTIENCVNGHNGSFHTLCPDCVIEILRVENAWEVRDEDEEGVEADQEIVDKVGE